MYKGYNFVDEKWSRSLDSILYIRIIPVARAMFGLAI